MNRAVERLAQVVVPIEGGFDPASEAQIQTAEARLGIMFPSILRDIQTTFGRCMFSGEAVISVGDENIGIFTIFGCKGAVGNLVSDFEAHPEMKVEGMIPFADDMFNNRFAWRSRHGDVLFVDYANRLPPRAVAASLEEFFRKVKVVPD